MASTVQTHPLISIRSSATVQDAARLMADCSIAALGVLDKDRRFTGIVTERDLSWFVAQAKSRRQPPLRRSQTISRSSSRDLSTTTQPWSACGERGFVT
jgi:CBS-domain-containing membrane protein